MERRKFLQSGLAAGASMACLGTFSYSHAAKALVENRHIITANNMPAKVRLSQQFELPRHFDSIDSFEVTHKIRDGYEFKIPAPSIYKDAVIVGGGISGLTAMSGLSDFDTLLLEKEPQLGGNSRRRSRNDIFYPLGAVTSQGAEKPFTDFFDDLKVPFEKVTTPELSYYIDNKLIIDPLGKGLHELPFRQKVKQDFQRLIVLLAGYLDEKNGIFFPIEDNVTNIQKLDQISLTDYLQNNAFPKQVIEFCNIVISSRLGDRGDNISAWMALYILSRFNAPTYSLPGGHGVISELLTEKIKQNNQAQIISSATTVSVNRQANGQVWTTFLTADGELVTAESSAAILATPKVISKLMVKELGSEQFKAMSSYRYSAYLVAQVALKDNVMPTFELMTHDLFSRFIVSADWFSSNKNEEGLSHLTVYIPYPNSIGRIRLYTSEAEQIAAKIVQDLIQIFPDIGPLISQIDLHRWGHPMVMPEPNISKRLELAKQPLGNIFFAHSDNMGISGLYSAVWSGMDAYTSAWVHLEEKLSI